MDPKDRMPAWWKDWRRILGTVFKSEPPPGGFRVTNIYVNAEGKTVVEYDDEPVK